jgi:hypothetical protein
MVTSMSNMCRLTSDWWYAAVMGLLLIFPAVGQAEVIPFTFMRVVDTNTPIPGGTGNFIFWLFADVSAPFLALNGRRP